MIEGKIGESSWRVLDKILLRHQQEIAALAKRLDEAEAEIARLKDKKHGE